MHNVETDRVISSFFVTLLWYSTLTSSSPSVYIVTPSTRTNSNEGRSAPFYYHDWMRRIDTPQNVTTSTTPNVKTPDLIFAEFEADSGDHMQKSIKKLLEQERVQQNTISSTSDITTRSSILDNVKTSTISEKVTTPNNTRILNSESDATDYFTLYNNLYNDIPARTYTLTTTTTSSTTAPSSHTNVENIWHIIDSEKRDKYSGAWEELPLDSHNDQDKANQANPPYKVLMDQQFALPGLHTNHGHGAENESRAIRTEPDVRFPYVNLKPYQIKNFNKPTINVFSNRQQNNMLTNLDQFKEIRNPVRGEVQDMVPIRHLIERYNPAQPYLPPESGSKSKQSPQLVTSVKTVSNLVPPPPPPPPKATGDDFPAPTSYESFPPFSDTSPNISPSLPVTASRLPTNNDDSDEAIPSVGYRYKPSAPSFLPTIPPVSKPFGGYVYKPNSDGTEFPSPMDGYTYTKPSLTVEAPPKMNMNSHSLSKPHEEIHYAPQHHHLYNPTFDSHDSDYPEFIYEKPHSGSEDNKEESGMKESHDTKNNEDMKDVGMMAPPPPPNMKPDMDSSSSPDDHGFPPDFPGDLKFHHDFDDHDYFHHYHHPKTTTTTTTTTTESPRVNRFSYYYLGKKLYYLPLYFSVYFIVYVGALIIKAVLRHKIVYPNSWRPNGTTATFFSKRSLDSWNFSNENLHQVTGTVTRAIAEAAEKYMNKNADSNLSQLQS